jgi:hypothetical protein
MPTSLVQRKRLSKGSHKHDDRFEPNSSQSGKPERFAWSSDGQNNPG